MSRDGITGNRRSPINRPGLGQTVEKPKNFKETWGKLIVYCKKYVPMVVFALIMAVLGTVMHILGPNMIGQMTDEIIAGLPALVDGVPVIGAIDFVAVRRIGTILVLFYSSSVLMNFTQGYVLATVTQKVGKNMRTDISHKINKLPLKYFDNVAYGDILSRVTNDVDTIGATLNQSIGSLVTSAVMFIGSGIMMFYNNWLMALTAIVSSLIGFVMMGFIMGKSQKHFARQQKDLGAVNGYVEEIFSCHSIVKAYNGGDESKQVFDGINEALYDSGWKSQFMSGIMMPLMMFIGNLGYVAVCVVGAVLALNGYITFGVIAAFMIYIRLFTNPLSQLAQAFQNLQRTVAASERVFEFFEEREQDDESHKYERYESVRGDIEFRNVRFGYSPERTIIHDFSASVAAGQKIAIVGPTGAGKTTIVNLLMRFYELDGGEILLDGIPTSNVPRDNVHSQFCMVLQDTWLFEGSVRENIVYCKEGVSDEQVIEVCKVVGLHHFISTLPKGYDTVLGDKASLSQGQKQLVTIARAMLRDTPMLILDEATSSVDTRTEHLVQAAMDKLTAGRTSFVIAHRLSTIRNADLILVLKDGDIIESGTHSELLGKDGFYADLYNSQFEALI